MRSKGTNSLESSSDTRVASGSRERQLVDAAWAQFEKSSDRSSASSRWFLSIPGYRILSEIHRGGQGVVYQAIQESTRRKIAIKVLKHGPVADRIELARFEREVDVLSRLNHPHIVAIYDRGLTDGHAYYVMDYIPGQALDAYVAGRQLDTNGILTLFAKICDAVNVAHLRGVIHRDLKPGNIRIDTAGEPRILDFGLAKLEKEVAGGSSAQGMTLTGQFVGSLPWASPEQADGRGDVVDIRTDVYSLGIILYQLLTATFPYPVTGRIDEVVRQIRETSPARPTSTVRPIEHDLELIVLKSLAKEPERRYQSAGDLARDIRRFLADEPILATSPSTGYRLRKFVRRNRGAVIAAASVASILLIASVVSITFGISAGRQRKAAEDAKSRAETAEGAARARADELDKVAKFQQAQLAGINAQTMGVRLRSDLLEKARVAAERSKLSPQEAKTRIEDLERFIAGSDFTGLALESLEENFFKPSLDAIEKQFADQPVIKASLLQTIATTLREVGLFEAAVSPQEAALSIRRSTLGDEHPDTLESISFMGVLLHNQGKFEQAEPYYREALAKYPRVLGDEHQETLAAINNMAILLQSQGKPDQAEPYYREALEKRRRVLGDEHPDTLNSIHSMGLLLQAQGKLDQAELYYREAVEKRRRVLGDEHLDTLTSLNNMGFLLNAQGKLDQAELYLREALAKYRRILGDDHPDTLRSMTNLCFVLNSQGKLDQAELYLREALEKYRRVLSDEHPNALSAMSHMGFLLHAQGKLDQAELYFREVLEKSRRVLGEEHPDTLIAINNLGVLLKSQDRLDQAEPYYREALEKSRRIQGDEHPDTLTSINNMGFLLKDQGKLDEAERHFREAIEKSRRVLGDEHQTTLIAITHMGSLLKAQGKPLDAVDLLAPAEPAVRRTFAEGNTLRLGRFLTALGRSRAGTAAFEQAGANLNEAQAILSNATGATQQDRSEMSAGMVELYDAWHAAEPDKGYDAKAAEWRAKQPAN